MPQQQTFAFLDEPSPRVAHHAVPLPTRPSSLSSSLSSSPSALSTTTTTPSPKREAFFSTGCEALDQWLPGGGLQRGKLCQWVSMTGRLNTEPTATTAGPSAPLEPSTRPAASAYRSLEQSALPEASAYRSPKNEFLSTRNTTRGGHPFNASHAGPCRSALGTGAGSLAMAAAASAMQHHRGPLLIIDPVGDFHAAAAIAWGIAANRMVWVRPTCRRDAVWSIDQALRCRSVAAVVAMLPWDFNDRDARRWQLSAESGNTPGLLVRRGSHRQVATETSFAAVRWVVEPMTQSAVNHSLWNRPPRDRRWVRVRLDRVKGVASLGDQLAPAMLSPQARSLTLAITQEARLQVVDSSTSIASNPITRRRTAVPTSTTVVAASHDSTHTAPIDSRIATVQRLAAQLARAEVARAEVARAKEGHTREGRTKVSATASQPAVAIQPIANRRAS
ncbi:MAG: hypothetical protein AAF539_07895 [Planctomycetota bacterium]